MFEEKNFIKFKNNLALIDNNKKLTYIDLLNLSKKITSKIKYDSFVFLLCTNNKTAISMYIGLLNKNCKVMLLDININNNYLNKLIKKYNPKYILISENKKLLIKSKNFIKIINNKNYKIISSNKKISNKINKNLCLLLSTSGTTGNPKFVMISKENLKDNTKKIIQSLKKIGSVITTLPMQYSYGLSVLNTHLLAGKTIILNNCSIIDPKFINLYKKYSPNCFYGVPFIFEILIKIKFNFIFHKNLFFLANAGGKIEEKKLKQIIKCCEKNNSKFFSMYGQTEASPRMAINDCINNKLKYSSIGSALNGGNFQIIKKGKILSKPHIEGELTYKGKNVFLGYSNSAKDLQIKSKKKVLFTGDIAKYDKDKFIYIVGRKKRIIKLFGLRINLDDIEKVLLEKNHKCKCDFNDEKLIIKYSDKKINIQNLKKFLSKKIRINENYIFFKLTNSKEINKNKKMKL